MVNRDGICWALSRWAFVILSGLYLVFASILLLIGLAITSSDKVPNVSGLQLEMTQGGMAVIFIILAFISTGLGAFGLGASIGLNYYCIKSFAITASIILVLGFVTTLSLFSIANGFLVAKVAVNIPLFIYTVILSWIVFLGVKSAE